MRFDLQKHSRLLTAPPLASKAVAEECPHCHNLFYWLQTHDEQDAGASAGITASGNEDDDVPPSGTQHEPKAGRTAMADATDASHDNRKSKSISASASRVIDVISDAMAQDPDALSSSRGLEGLEGGPSQVGSDSGEPPALTTADVTASTSVAENVWRMPNGNRKVLRKQAEAKELESLGATDVAARQKLKRKHSRALAQYSHDRTRSDRDGDNSGDSAGSRSGDGDLPVVVDSSHNRGLAPASSASSSMLSTRATVQLRMTELLASNHPGMPEARIAECVHRACAISPMTVLQELHTSLSSARRRQSGSFGYTPQTELSRATSASSGSWTKEQLSEELRTVWRSAQSISADLFVRVVAYRIRLAEFYRLYQAWQDCGPRKRFSVAKQRAFYLVNPNLPERGSPIAKTADLAVKTAWTKFDNDLKFAAKMAVLEEELGQAAFMMLPSTSFPNEFFRTLPLAELKTWAAMVRRYLWPEESFTQQAWLVTQQLLSNDLPDQLTVLEAKGLPGASDQLPYTRLLELSDTVHTDTESI